MNGIIEGIVGNVVWSGTSAFFRRVAGRQIEITDPRPQEVLKDSEPLGPGLCFPIRGTLKHLPKRHEIWLLTEDESTGLVWPQGFFAVQFNHHQGTWMGKVYGSRKQQVKIIAVVAPPTAQDFFRYYQKLGRERNYQFEPLNRVPVECTNRASVQAFIP